jgi:hypothetical protein
MVIKVMLNLNKNTKKHFSNDNDIVIYSIDNGIDWFIFLFIKNFINFWFKNIIFNAVF